MKKLTYKASTGKTITFDEYTIDREYGTVWVTICPNCRNKYKNELRGKMDDFGSGCCSVLGCNNPGSDDEDMRYADFQISETDLDPLHIVLDTLDWSDNAAEAMTMEEWNHLHDNDPRENDAELF